MGAAVSEAGAGDTMSGLRKIRLLVNPRSGLRVGGSAMLRHAQEVWDGEGRELTIQFSRSAEDGKAKALRAIEEGADTILVAGGDGMVNSIGSVLVGTHVALGVIPTGSGNGFARHFEIPLQPRAAAEALLNGRRTEVDVGVANGRPFFVTCSMAWDAAIARTFEKSPVRGILPYVFAAAYELIDYKVQRFEVRLDDGPWRAFDEPMVFTAANLTQFGGGARIAPLALEDDGLLELVIAEKKDAARIVPNLPRLFTGTMNDNAGLQTYRFKKMSVRRENAFPIQLDGECIESGPEVEIDVLPRALCVLAPAGRD